MDLFPALCVTCMYTNECSCMYIYVCINLYKSFCTDTFSRGPQSGFLKVFFSSSHFPPHKLFFIQCTCCPSSVLFVYSKKKCVYIKISRYVCICLCVYVMSQCVAVCCSVLQCVPVCCSVLQCVAVCCSVLQSDI